MEDKKMKMNLPNSITILRIALVPVFICFFYDPTPVRAFVAGLFFVIASLTDLLDGYLARKRGEVTVLGKLLDPVADKMLIVSALIMLVDFKQVSAVVVIIIITREVFVTGLRAIASSMGIIIPAARLGKYKLIIQIVAISFLVFNYSISLIPFLDVMGRVLLWGSLVLAVVSGAQYFRRLLVEMAEIS